MKLGSPEYAPPAKRHSLSEDAKRHETDHSFNERGGKTVTTEPLSPEEIAFVHGGYKGKEKRQEARIPNFPKEIANKIRQTNKLALLALTAEERSELYAYLDVVWLKHKNLAKIINHFMTLLDPDETPTMLSKEACENLIRLIDDPDAMAKRFDEEGYEK